MPTHWTYKEFKPEDGLYQGDIIAREPLLDVLRIVHNHFTDPKYLAFIVLTQTCDLVVRKKVCKAKHICLAVVRPLSALMPTILEEMCHSPRPGVFSRDRRTDAEDFLHRVLNQNEQANGWVYLHPDADAGIGESAVAMLRISISLRAAEHYELIRKARCGRLDTEYRNKLGWLKGNLYSRIDTTDWTEKDSGDEEEKSIIKDLLDAQVAERPPLWVPSTWIEEARRKQVKLAEIPAGDVERVLREHAPKPSLEVALDEVKRVVNQMRVEFTDQAVAAFQIALDADASLLPLVAHDVASAVGRALGVAHDQRSWELQEAVLNDALLREKVLAVLNQAATAFIQRRGERKLHLFAGDLATLSLFTGDALSRAAFLSEEVYGAEYLANAQTAQAALASLKCPAQLVSHLRIAAAAAIQESLADLTEGRLRNSTPFKRAARPE